MTTFVNLPNQNQNQNQNDSNGNGFYNLIARSVYGTVKRFRKLDKGGYYIDFVASVGKRVIENDTKTYSGQMVYSSLRVVNKSDVENLLALDKATEGSLSSPNPDNPVKVVLDVADLNVRAFQGKNRAGSVAVGSLLKISHVEWGDTVFTQNDAGPTIGKSIIKSQLGNLDTKFSGLDKEELNSNHFHFFEGVCFINRVDFQENGVMRVACQFLHGKKSEVRRTRIYVNVTEGSSLHELINDKASLINEKDSKVFARVAINVTGTGAWSYTDKDNEEKLFAAIYADIANISYLSINGEVVLQQQSNANVDDSSSENQNQMQTA